MTAQTTEVKVFSYNEAADTFNCKVNGVEKEIPATDFSEAFQSLRDIELDRMSGNHIDLTVEEMCLANIYETHFEEEPTDLCFTFYELTR